MRMFSFLLGSFVLWLVMVACDGSNDPDPTATPSPGPGATVTATTPAGETPAPTATPEPGGEIPELTLEPLVRGLDRPVLVTHAGDGSGRLFAIEKPGIIRIIEDGAALEGPFLDIRDLVEDGGNEQGLLGLAFHPGYAENGRFFVAYTTSDTNTVAEYRVSPDPYVADSATGKVLFAQPDPYRNHNGGMLAFGPDGYLYISMGDGGSAGDPNNSGQRLDTLLGKILRIDVDSGDPYGIPDSNPFIGTSGAEPEIWAYGLRNPWRISFDRETGDLWIADVGQNRLEEVNFQPADSAGGENYGWRLMEGSDCFQPQSGCNTGDLVLPVFEYDHGQGCSITGGYVYRGEAIPELRGVYLFTDYCSGTLWATRQVGGEFETQELGTIAGGISAFGEDENGELYVVSDPQGTIYRLISD